jgi:hypothetical protein
LGGKENVWASKDETGNASGRKAADIIIGVSKNGQMLSEKLFLLSWQEVSAVNCATVAHVFNEAIHSVLR